VEVPLTPVRKEPIRKGGGLLYKMFYTGCETGANGPLEPVSMPVFLLVGAVTAADVAGIHVRGGGGQRRFQIGDAWK
jgi:hypothetical protein